MVDPDDVSFIRFCCLWMQEALDLGLSRRGVDNSLKRGRNCVQYRGAESQSSIPSITQKAGKRRSLSTRRIPSWRMLDAKEQEERGITIIMSIH